MYRKILVLKRKTKDGYVYVWGLNSNGELGIGTYNRVTTPTLLDYVNNVLDISLGKNHTIILTTNGKILTSGLNSYQHAAPAEVRAKYPWLVPVHADGVVGGKKEFTLLNKSEMELLADAYEMETLLV